MSDFNNLRRQAEQLLGKEAVKEAERQIERHITKSKDNHHLVNVDGVEFTPSRSKNNKQDGNTPSTDEAALDEKELIDFLEGLTPSDFSRILARLPETINHISTTSPHHERVAALVLYMRSSVGPGLERLVEVLDEMFPDKGHFQSIRQQGAKADNSNTDEVVSSQSSKNHAKAAQDISKDKPAYNIPLSLAPTPSEIKSGPTEIAVVSSSERLIAQAIKGEYIYGILGIVLGLSSIILGLNGVSGATSWTAKVLGLSSQINDAAPGVVLFIVGIFLVWITKPKVNMKNLKG